MRQARMEAGHIYENTVGNERLQEWGEKGSSLHNSNGGKQIGEKEKKQKKGRKR